MYETILKILFVFQEVAKAVAYVIAAYLVGSWARHGITFRKEIC
jgi:hypothetical protein